MTLYAERNASAAGVPIMLENAAHGERRNSLAVVENIAARPAGGRRRADTSSNVIPFPGALLDAPSPIVIDPMSSRARRSPDAYLVDAFDAASFIARRSLHWDITAVLGHSSLAQIAAQEAEEALRADIDALPRRGLLRRPDEEAVAALEAELMELHHCLRLLLAVQATGVLDGY